jgi:PhnB protein
MSVKKIPDGASTVTPYLMVDGTAEAIRLYAEVFGAKELRRINMPGSDKIMHACIEIGTSKIFLSDLNPERGCTTPTSSTFYIYKDDVDATFKQAIKSGFKEVSAPADMFWGDRTGIVADKFGNVWTIATHVRDLSQEEIDKAALKAA